MRRNKSSPGWFQDGLLYHTLHCSSIFCLMPLTCCTLFWAKASRRELDPFVIDSLHQLLVDFFSPRFQWFYWSQFIYLTCACFDSHFKPLQSCPDISLQLPTTSNYKLLGNCAFGVTGCSCRPTSISCQYSWDRIQHAWNSESRVINKIKWTFGCRGFH